MDRRHQERLVGAVVLVVLAVTVVPWLLDGPPSTAREQASLDLPQSSRTSMRRQTIALGSEREAPQTPVPMPIPVPEARPPAEPPPTPRVAAEPATPEADPPRQSAGEIETAPPPAPSKSGPDPAPTAVPGPLESWAVQVGSFASRANADALSKDLKQRGYRSFVARFAMDNRVVYRVRVGPEPDNATARTLAERLRQDGEDVAVVRHP